jgi:hypothetical protein
VELLDELIANDLDRMQGPAQKRLVPIGRRADGSLVTVAPYGPNILIAGPSGSGKSTVAAGIVERLMALAYQLCIVDPEGDYGTLLDVLTLGDQRHAVSVSEVHAFLEDPKITLNVNLLGIPLADRPEFFGQLFPNLQAMRTRTGRPHWIVLDEAHHMLPAEWAPLDRALPQSVGEMVFVTVHPDHVASLVLSLVDVIFNNGSRPEATIQEVRWTGLASLSRGPVGLSIRKEKPSSGSAGRGRVLSRAIACVCGPSQFAISECTPKAICATAVSFFGGRGINTT